MWRRNRDNGMVLMEAAVGLMIAAVVVLLISSVSMGRSAYEERQRCYLQQAEETLMHLREPEVKEVRTEMPVTDVTESTTQSIEVTTSEANSLITETPTVTKGASLPVSEHSIRTYEIVKSHQTPISHVEFQCSEVKEVIQIERTSQTSVRFSPR